MPSATSHARLSTAALLVGLALRAGAAEAQALTPIETAQLREQFQLGVEAARADRWADALGAFTRAYQLAPEPMVLFNLASAQVETGHLVEGAEDYRRFLRVATSEPASRRRDDAQAALDAVEPRIPHARVRVTGLLASDSVAVDGARLATSALAAPLPLDPGAHALVVVRDGREVGRAAFELAEGATRDVVVAVDATVARVPVPSPLTVRVLAPVHPGRSQPHRASVLTSPWFWTVAGVLVAGGTLGALGAAGVFAPTGSFTPGRLSVD